MIHSDKCENDLCGCICLSQKVADFELNDLLFLMVADKLVLQSKKKDENVRKVICAKLCKAICIISLSYATCNCNMRKRAACQN